MTRTSYHRLLVLTVVSMMLMPGLSLATPAGDGAPADADDAGGWDLPGTGEGMETRALTPDPLEDQFISLLPWPTNRTLYGIHWRPGGDYGLAIGSGGSLFKVTTSAIERIETATLESIYDVAWKVDGSEALLVGNHSTLLVWDAVAGDLSRVDIAYDQRFLGATWDPTGTYALIVGSEGFVGRFNGTDVAKYLSGLTDFIYRIKWRPGGDRAMAVGDNGLMLEVNTTEITSSTRLNANWGLWRMDWEPGGTYALISGKNYAYVTPRSMVLRYNATGTYDQLPVPGGLTVGLRAVDFAPTGTKAVIAGENSTVLRWAGTALTNLLAPGDRTLRGTSWQGTANELLVVGNRGVMMHYDGFWSNRSYDPRQDMYSIAWRPQGDYGLVVGRGGVVSKVSVGGSVAIDSGTTRDLFDVSWSSDGSYAVACGGGGEVLRHNHGDTDMFPIKSPLMLTTLHGISVRPSSDVIVAVGDAGSIWYYSSGIWTSKRGTEARNLRDVAWRPDGEYAIIVGVSGIALNITTSSATAVPFQPQPPTFAALFSVAWDKDGDKLMLVGSLGFEAKLDTIWVFDHAEWQQVDSFENTTYYGCTFTADGEVGVAFGAPDVIVRFSTVVGEGLRSSFRSPYTIPQRAAMHPDGRTVYFAGINGYAYRMDVGEFENEPPRVVIVGPETGSQHNIDEPIELNATGTWDPDGDDLAFTWVSNVSGVISTKMVDAVTISQFGWHRIDLYVDDGKGHNVTDFTIIKLVVPNYPPVPMIVSPVEGTNYTNEDLIVFDGNGSHDPNEDPITYQWVSDLTGDIGYGERVESTLKVGEHRIILWVEDVEGERSKAEVNISVVQANRPPVVYITSPLENQRFDPGEEIELNASYTFDPDGDELTFSWESDEDGDLGTGPVLSVTLSEGPHALSVTVDDGYGHPVTAIVNVTVAVPENTPPVVVIVSPPSDSILQGVQVISGTTFDPDGDPITVQVAIGVPDGWEDATLVGDTWSYTWDTTGRPNGQYSVFVEASDGQATTREWTQYLVDNQEPSNTPPEVELRSPQPGSVRGKVTLEGVASDTDGDPIEEVQVRFDSGLWQRAEGGYAWSFLWDTVATPNGQVTVSVRASDGTDWSEIQTYQFTVDNEEDGPTTDDGLSWGVIVAILVIALVLVAVLAYMMLVRGPRQ